MNPRRASALILIFIFVLAVACLAGFPYIVRFSEWFHSVTGLPVCPVNDWFDIRCPLCGGTRCAAALMRFDFAKALYYNPFVVIFGVVAFVWYVRMAVLMLSGRINSIDISRRALTVLTVAVVGFTIVRNMPFYRIFLY